MKPAEHVLDRYHDEEIVYAKNQHDYLPLPALPIGDPTRGIVLTRWTMSLRERIKVLFSGSVFVQIMTFRQPLQPIAVSVDQPSEDPSN